LEVQDDEGLSGFIFSSNNSGIWVNESWIPLTGTEDVIEVIKDINPATGLVIGWKVFVNDTDDEWTSSGEYAITTGEKKEEQGFIIPIIVVVAFAVILFLIIMKIINKKPGKRKVHYVYSKEHAR
jgi:hypothetical protein